MIKKLISFLLLGSSWSTALYTAHVPHQKSLLLHMQKPPTIEQARSSHSKMGGSIMRYIKDQDPGQLEPCLTAVPADMLPVLFNKNNTYGNFAAIAQLKLEHAKINRESWCNKPRMKSFIAGLFASLGSLTMFLLVTLPDSQVTDKQTADKIFVGAGTASGCLAFEQLWRGICNTAAAEEYYRALAVQKLISDNTIHNRKKM